MQACFIGHRKIDVTEELVSSLKDVVETLVNEDVTSFLFGSKSAFDDLAWEVVTDLKNKYPHIKRIYVRASYQYVDEFYEKFLLESYEETYFPKKVEKAGKYAYVKRNLEMIDNSTFCIFYYSESYAFSIKRSSGTKTAYEYAIKKGKAVKNLYKK